MVLDKEYLVLQTKYHKMHNNKKDIYPEEWYNIREYELKKNILRECINNNILIKNSSMYYEFRLKALNS